MRIDYSFLCDYADPTGGKIHALGIGIDTIFLPAAPGVAAAGFWFVAQLAASAAETGDKQLEIKLLSPDGQVIVGMDGQLHIGPPPIAGQPSRARVAMQFAGIPFPAYGVYSVNMVINGSEVTAVPIMVSPPPAPPATA